MPDSVQEGVTHDKVNGILYIPIKEAVIKATAELSATVLVDLDDTGNIIGIEISYK